MEIEQDKFEDQELEELKQLTIKHRRGEIDDLDFEEQAAWLLRGRSFPVLTTMPEIKKSDENQTNEQKKQKELKTLTSCGERSKRARQSYIRKHRESKHDSIVAKALKQESNNSSVNNSSITSLRIEESILTSSVNNPLVAATQESEEINFKPLIFTLVATVLLITILLALLLTRKDTVQIVTNEQQNILLTTHYQYQSLPIPFGPSTVNECNKLCAAKNGEDCESSCRKLSFEMYPHRISLKDNTPNELADEIEKKCKDSFKETKKPPLIENIPSELNFTPLESLSTEELIKEFSYMSALHDKTLKNVNYKKTSVAACLRANEINSYIGALVANSYRDYYSAGFYQLTQRAFAKKNVKNNINN